MESNNVIPQRYIFKGCRIIVTTKKFKDENGDYIYHEEQDKDFILLGGYRTILVTLKGFYILSKKLKLKPMSWNEEELFRQKWTNYI